MTIKQYHQNLLICCFWQIIRKDRGIGHLWGGLIIFLLVPVVIRKQLIYCLFKYHLFQQFIILIQPSFQLIMADIFNFQRFGPQYMHMSQSQYQNYPVFQNHHFYPQTQFITPNFNLPQFSTNLPSHHSNQDNKVIIDLETTENHSICALSESSEKHHNIFSQNDLEIREQVESSPAPKIDSFKEQTLEQNPEDDTLENLASVEIFNSSVLNPKCHFCSSTLLTSQLSSRWVQCNKCLELFHEDCQIVKRNQLENGPICHECNKNSEVQEPKIIKKVARRIKKLPKKAKGLKLNVFKQRTESSIYLDSFLSGFGYRLGISEIQIQKQIDSLRRQRARVQKNLSY